MLTQIELFTDDNFQFSRAAKAIRQAIEGLPCIYSALEPPGAKHLPEEEPARPTVGRGTYVKIKSKIKWIIGILMIKLN